MFHFLPWPRIRFIKRLTTYSHQCGSAINCKPNYGLGPHGMRRGRIAKLLAQTLLAVSDGRVQVGEMRAPIRQTSELRMHFYAIKCNFDWPFQERMH